MAIAGALGALGALGGLNAQNSISRDRSISEGGSSGGGSSSSYGWSEGGTYGTGATASALSHAMMEEANRFNAEQAELNRKWQEKMANTAYQRAMTDLKKAGLNPILAYTNGPAATGTGATASSAMGTAYTDTTNKSYNSGESSNFESSWNHSKSQSYSMSKSDIANQIGSIIGMTSGMVAGVVEDLPEIKSSAKGVFDKVYETGQKWWNNLGNNPTVTTSNGSWRNKK